METWKSQTDCKAGHETVYFVLFPKCSLLKIIKSASPENTKHSPMTPVGGYLGTHNPDVGERVCGWRKFQKDPFGTAMMSGWWCFCLFFLFVFSNFLHAHGLFL